MQKAKVALIGVGGCGSNLLNAILEAEANAADAMAINRDRKGLAASLAGKKICLKARSASQVEDTVRQSRPILKRFLKGRDKVILFAGMGGVSGTRASPLIADCAVKAGLSVLAVVVMPFDFENGPYRECADEGLHGLVDAGAVAAVFSNQALIKRVPLRTSMPDAFELVNSEVLNLIGPLLNSDE